MGIAYTEEHVLNCINDAIKLNILQEGPNGGVMVYMSFEDGSEGWKEVTKEFAAKDLAAQNMVEKLLEAIENPAKRNPDDPNMPTTTDFQGIESFVGEQIFLLYELEDCTEEEMAYADSKLEEITKKYLEECDAWEAQNSKEIPLSTELEIMHNIILDTIKDRFTPEKKSLSEQIESASHRANVQSESANSKELNFCRE